VALVVRTQCPFGVELAEQQYEVEFPVHLSAAFQQCPTSSATASPSVPLLEIGPMIQTDRLRLLPRGRRCR
jgi:hypothetical protein